MHQEILELTKKFISIPSDTTDRDACLHILELAQKELEGFTFLPFAKNGIPSLLYTNTDTPTKQCKIILNAHLDVVPGKPNQFVPIMKDGKLYGRGAFDMKAAAAVEILIFKEVAKQLPYTLGLQIVTDEETIGYNGVNYQIEQGVTADFVISGECGSNLRIVNQLRGLYVIKLIAKGKEAHAGHSWHGENALLKLYETIDGILKHYPTPKEPSWQTTVNLASIETNNKTHNIVPGDATALLDIRPIPEDTNKILERIKQLLPEGITMELIKTMPAHHTKETNPYVQKLKDSIQSTLKQPAEVSHNFAGSDIIFYFMNNMNSVEFGPRGWGQHKSDEWVDIKSLEDYYSILKRFLIDIT